MAISIRLVKRAENSELPLMALAAITELRQELEELTYRHVLEAKKRGAAWDDIASALGITRQALQQRMKAREDPISIKQQASSPTRKS